MLYSRQQQIHVLPLRQQWLLSGSDCCAILALKPTFLQHSKVSHVSASWYSIALGLL